MKDVVFITGNQAKADYLAKYLEHSVEHVKLELDEIQSLDVKEIVRHKMLQAYTKVGRPVLVEDVSLEFAGLGGLPGPFIRWFLETLSHEQICRLLDGKDRSAVARTVMGYYDRKEECYFEGRLSGTVPQKPGGSGGFGGWDPIFVPEGYTITRAQMGEEDDRKTYLKIKPFEQVKTFLTKE